MLVAYLDEFGHVGPFISADHDQHKTHPVFGYAGFVLPASNVRHLGGCFESMKESLLKWEIERAKAHPRRWEKKGAALFTTRNNTKYGRDITRTVSKISTKLHTLGGSYFYFGQVKPLGEEAETKESAEARNTHALLNAIRGLARYAHDQKSDIMIFLDAVDNKPRIAAVSAAAGFIYGAKEDGLRRVVEVPMQLESKHYGLVQFADWTCAILGRSLHHHLVPNSEFSWAPGVLREITPDRSRVLSSSKIDAGHYVPGARNTIKHAHILKEEVWSTSEINRPVEKKPRARRIPEFRQSIGEAAPGLLAFRDNL